MNILCKRVVIGTETQWLLLTQIY